MERSSYVQYQGCELGWSALSEAQYDAIVRDGSLAGTESPMLSAADYQSLVAVMEPADVNPRWPLAICWAEGHDGTDPGLAAASVNNLGGVKWVGQAGATDSGIAADTGGTYAAFADLTAYWTEVVRILGNEIIGPCWSSGDLVSVAEHWTNGPGTGHNKVAQFVRYCQVWPADTGQPQAGAVVTPADLVRVALGHVGEARMTDGWGGDHAVGLRCEEDVEDWLVEVGLPVVHYYSAAVAGDAAPLTTGRAPKGALVYFRGPGWSVDDHTGLSLGDGRTISGLSTVTVSDGWQDLPSYRGWRWPVGISLVPVMDAVHAAAGNPYGPVGMRHPFWSRWDLLNRQGLALPMMGWPVGAERTLENGRRVQEFERGWYGTQEAPDPWDLVQLLMEEAAALEFA